MDRQSMKKKLGAAARYSYSRLALNYYMYFEQEADRGDGGSAFSRRFRKEFQRLLGDFLNGKEDVEALDTLRKGATREMEIVTAYTDCFQVYEHVLNRLEYRFLPEKKNGIPEEDDQTMVSEIIHFLISSKDSAVMNNRIQMIVEQLPIRFTKAKFFSLVQSGLSVYKGSQKSSLDAILYMLRTESMLQLPEGMEERRDLWDILQQFKTADYRNLTSEAYQNLSAGLTLASQRLLDDSGELVFAMDLINDLYVLLLSRNDGMMEGKEEQSFVRTLDTVWRRLEAEDFSVADEEIDSLLIDLEGKQERYFEKWLRLELPHDGKENDEEKELYDRLKTVDRLLSGSPFIELQEEESENLIVDEKMLEQEEGILFGQLEELWTGMPRAVVRGIMARILSSLPVFFNSIEEVEEYIQNSLAACTDADEKIVSMELIREIMVDENEIL